MGIINHECIIATTWDRNIIDKFAIWSTSLPKHLQELIVFVPSLNNGMYNIFVATSGSKKGWAEDREHKNFRNKIIAHFTHYRECDGSSAIQWVEIGYGEYGQNVLSGNNVNKYSNDQYYHGCNCNE